VNVCIPLALIRAGVKLTALIPSVTTTKWNEALKEKGMDYDLRNLKADDLKELVNALSDLEVNVQGSREKVRVYVK
jgi:hypothetical protein